MRQARPGLKIGRPPGKFLWTREDWYRKWREAKRNSHRVTLAMMAARLGISETTASKYYARWGAPLEQKEGWELRVNVDEIRRVVHLSAQFPGLGHPIARITLTYEQARVLYEDLDAIVDQLVTEGAEGL